MKKLLVSMLFLLCAVPAFGQLVISANLSGVVNAPIDQNGWQSFKVNLTQNITFNFVIAPPAPVPAQSTLRVIFTQDATGGRTVTFASNISNPCAVNASANVTTICQFSFDGTTNTWVGISPSLQPSPQVLGTSAAVTNIYVPLASGSTFTSIVCNGATCVISGCNIANCAITGTPTLNIGGNTVNCFDVSGNVTGTTATTATFTTTQTCTDNSTTYTQAIGQYKPAFCVWNTAGIFQGNYTCKVIAADGHASDQNYNNNALLSNCDALATGEYSCGSTAAHRNMSFGIGSDANFCAGQPYANLNGACTTTAFNNSGQMVMYRSQNTQDTMASPFKIAATFSGSTYNSINYTSPTVIYTAPASGPYQNAMYEAHIFFQEDSAAAGATLFITLTYQQAVTGTSVSQSTCSVNATNATCVGTTGTATSMASIGNFVEAIIPFSLQPSGTLSLTLTSANTPAGIGFLEIYRVGN